MSSSADVLSELTKTTESRISSLQNRSTRDYAKELTGLSAEIDALEKVENRQERDRRKEILESNFDKLRTDIEGEQQDLAEAVFGLNAIFESMGEEYKDLLHLMPDEQALVDRSQRDMLDAQEARRSAEAMRWNIFGWKTRALTRSAQSLETAKVGMEQAQIQARQMARQRLLKANIEESLQEIMRRVEKTITLLENRMQIITEQLAAVSIRKAESFKIKEKAAVVIKRLSEELTAKEQELHKEEEVLATLTNGTPQYSTQSGKVSEYRRLVEDIRGRHNTALVLYQSKEKFATAHEVSEVALIKLRDNQKMWITALRSDTEERIVAFKARLEAMKAMSDQEVSKRLDEVGAAADQSNVEFMAKAATASDKARLNKMEQHPARIRAMEEVRAALAEVIQRSRTREGQILQDFKDRYGIDPFKSSFFAYEDNSGSKGEKASPGEPPGKDKDYASVLN